MEFNLFRVAPINLYAPRAININALQALSTIIQKFNIAIDDPANLLDTLRLCSALHTVQTSLNKKVLENEMMDVMKVCLMRIGHQ